MKIKEKANRFYRWEYFWLLLIVLAALAAHFSLISTQSSPILDERYYIQDAANISANHETLRIEHPPLAKLLILAGIKLFGDNPWGWRTLPILFGVITVVLFYLLCRKLDMTRTAASLAAFLLAFENLFFLMGSIAMLDVFYLTFMLAGFLLYASRKYVGAGAAIGLSTVSKLPGFFGGLTVLFDWIFSRRQQRTNKIWVTVIVSVVVFFAAMVLLDLVIVRQASGFLNPMKRVIDMLGLTGGLTFSNAENAAATPPWSWLYTWVPPVYTFSPTYIGAISYSVWLLIVPVFAYLVYLAKKRSDAGLFGLCWFIATYVIWIPVILVTRRITYIYYFYPAVGAVCLGLGIALSQLIDVFRRRRKAARWLALSAVVVVIAAHVFSFLILCPLIPVDILKLMGIPH
jgi:dolichyl-phosphate-mannose-protein mannosyltransferase